MRNVHPNHPQQKLIKNKLNYLSTNLTDNNILNLVRYKFLLILWGGEVIFEGNNTKQYCKYKPMAFSPIH